MTQASQLILFKMLHPEAQTPVRSSKHAAGFDLTAATLEFTGDKFIIGTGLATAFGEDHVLLIYGRSGYAFKHGIRLANGVGVIDADYRGEIKLAFHYPQGYANDARQLLQPGNRVAQAILTPIPQVIWASTTELPESVRGEGGFGSTGFREGNGKNC